MPPRAQVQTKLHVIRMSLNGASQSQTARTVRITQATVKRIVNAFRGEGRAGDLRRNCTTKTPEKEENKAMVKASCEDPFITADRIRDITGLDIGGELVRPWLHKADLKNHSATRKPLLSAAGKVERLAFAQAYVH